MNHRTRKNGGKNRKKHPCHLSRMSRGTMPPAGVATRICSAVSDWSQGGTTDFGTSWSISSSHVFAELPLKRILFLVASGIRGVNSRQIAENASGILRTKQT